jgi:hypothetical protein
MRKWFISLCSVISVLYCFGTIDLSRSVRNAKLQNWKLENVYSGMEHVAVVVLADA